MRKLYIILFLCILSGFVSKAQDIHMSHVHASPIYLNPAMTGMFNADMRMIADFRSQWRSVTTDYRTMYASVDMKTRTLFRRNSALGFGLEVFSDRAGDLDFRSYGAHFSLSGIKTLDGYHGKKVISAALKFGVLGNSLDYSKIIAFDEEPEIMNGIDNNILYADWSIGLGWFHELKKKDHTYHLGFSMNHINRPLVDFGIYNETQHPEELHRRITFHGGADLHLNKSMEIMPTFVFMDQGPHKEILMGTFWKYKTMQTAKTVKKSDLAIYLGVWGRWYFEFDGVGGFDAVVASVRADYMNTSITFSYDLNMSTLSLASYGRGGPEISIIQLLEWRGNNRRRVHCPAVGW